MKIRRYIKKLIYGKLPLVSGAFRYYGTKVYFPRSSLIFKMACEQGIYESQNIKIILNNICPNSIYFDIGTNIGLMSIPVLQSIPSCRVVSVEASPNNLPYLRRTIQESDFKDRWYIIDKAFGNSEGKIDFYLNSSQLGAFDGFHKSEGLGASTKINVTVTTLDLEWSAIGNPLVSFIKIDVEGSELMVLQGAINCIKKCRPYIMIEWNQEWLNKFDCLPQSILDFVESVQYSLLSVPNFNLINSISLLKLNMLNTETFLLVPSEIL